MSNWEKFKYRIGYSPAKGAVAMLVCALCDKVLGEKGNPPARVTKFANGERMYHCDTCYNQNETDVLLSKFLERIKEDKEAHDVALQAQKVAEQEQEDTKKFLERIQHEPKK